MRIAAALLSFLAACATPPAPSLPDPSHELPSPAPTAPHGTLRAATLNVWALPVVSQDLHERSKRVGPALARFQPDVICLQEVYDPCMRRRIASDLCPSWRPTTVDSPGLMILSRHPLRSVCYTPFPPVPNLSLVERLARKGILEAVVETPAGPARVVTTHLALDFGPGNARSAQLRFLLEHLDRKRDLPLLMPADLNTPPVWDDVLTDDFKAILARGYRSADPPTFDGTRHLPGSYTRVGWPRPRRVTRAFWPDHILFRDGATTPVTLVSFGVALADRKTAVSDHNLLLADFVLHN